jgi:hypothetical protein
VIMYGLSFTISFRRKVRVKLLLLLMVGSLHSFVGSGQLSDAVFPFRLRQR